MEFTGDKWVMGQDDTGVSLSKVVHAVRGMADFQGHYILCQNKFYSTGYYWGSHFFKSSDTPQGQPRCKRCMKKLGLT